MQYHKVIHDKKTSIKLFEEKRVRTVWDEEKKEWHFSAGDVVGDLTDSENLRKYWSVLKTRLKQEGNETATNCSQLKLIMPDRKMRLTDMVAEGATAAKVPENKLRKNTGKSALSPLNAKSGMMIGKGNKDKK